MSIRQFYNVEGIVKLCEEKEAEAKPISVHGGCVRAEQVEQWRDMTDEKADYVHKGSNPCEGQADHVNGCECILVG